MLGRLSPTTGMGHVPDLRPFLILGVMPCTLLAVMVTVTIRQMRTSRKLGDR